MVATRSWPVPPMDRTVHLIGDLHFDNIDTVRSTKIVRDITSNPMCPNPVLHMQMGDCSTNATGTEEANALTFLNQLPTTWHNIIGNHEQWGGRTGEQSAAAWNLSALNYTIDLGFVLLVCVGPSVAASDNTTVILSADTISWLDATLTAAGKPCWICCHAPLYNTAGAGGPGTEFRSTDSGFYVVANVEANRDNGVRDTPIKDVLADNPNAKLWLSGHTHSSFDSVVQGTFDLGGGRTIGHLNSGSIYYVTRTFTRASPLRTVYLTYISDTVFEVRWRNNGARVWEGPSGERVQTITVT